jgi:hypothetical protein
MGLLVSSENADDDFAAIASIAESVAVAWNEFGGSDHGFTISVGEQQIRECSEIGTRVLSKHFPKPPGPFKRVAGLVVLSRLYPFFELKNAPPPEEKTHEWLTRISALLIPGAFRSMQVGLNGPDSQETMPAWKGFPSLHQKAEILALLQWFDNFEWVSDDAARPPDLLDKRLARMFLATSLVLEGCYYIWEIQPDATTVSPVFRNCRKCVLPDANLTAFTYDALIYDAYAKAHPQIASEL